MNVQKGSKFVCSFFEAARELSRRGEKRDIDAGFSFLFLKKLIGL